MHVFLRILSDSRPSRGIVALHVDSADNSHGDTGIVTTDGVTHHCDFVLASSAALHSSELGQFHSDGWWCYKGFLGIITINNGS